jgi:hypothetical protein
LALELIFEIVAQIFIWILEVCGELLIQIFGESIAGLFEGKVAQRRTLRASTPPATASAPTFWQALGKCVLYTLAGAAIGWMSTLVFPHLLIRIPALELLHVVVSPVLAALAMVWIGRWRSQHHKAPVGFDKFMYAYSFALAMAVVRNAYAI